VICLLGEPDDIDLVWLAVALRERGQPVEVLLPDELTTDSSLTYRIGSAGVTWEMTLADGRMFGRDDLDLVVNRLTVLPLLRASTTDTDSRFLGEEWRAAAAAWLRLLTCPVLNPPRAANLPGPYLTTAEWRAVAYSFGVRCRPWRSDEVEVPEVAMSVTVIGSDVLDPSGRLGDGERSGLVELGRYVGAPLMGAMFEVAAEEVVFLHGDPLPPLMAGGSELVDAIERMAERSSRSSEAGRW
jgi:hypothetical protein